MTTGIVIPLDYIGLKFRARMPYIHPDSPKNPEDALFNIPLFEFD